MAYGFGVSLAAIRRGLQKAKPFPMRMQSENWRGIGIINDAYNANPASMEAAVQDASRDRRAAARKSPCSATCLNWAGKAARSIGNSANRWRAPGSIVCTYSAPKPSRCGRARFCGGMAAERIVIGKDHAEVAKLLRSHVRKGDWLLFKGSRGMKMEKVLDKLKSGKA